VTETTHSLVILIALSLAGCSHYGVYLVLPPPEISLVEGGGAIVQRFGFSPSRFVHESIL
jgi:hypothetical protein